MLPAANCVSVCVCVRVERSYAGLGNRVNNERAMIRNLQSCAGECNMDFQSLELYPARFRALLTNNSQTRVN